jgi:hypothetical protein
MRARVSMISFFSVCLIDIGMDKKFDSILAMVTEKISSTGEVDVDAALQLKNPLSQPPGRILLFQFCSLAW